MKNTASRAIQNINLFTVMCLYFFIIIIFFLSSGKKNELEMGFKTCRFWSCNISWQLCLLCLFVYLFGWFGFSWSKGTWELLERCSVSVLGWAVSLICSFNLYAALQQRELNFSPSSSLRLSASYNVACCSKPLHSTTFLSRSFFFF